MTEKAFCIHFRYNAPCGTEFIIKYIRPREDGEPVVTPLVWEKVIFSKSGFGDNLQLLPGDRLVLEVKE